MKNLTAFVKAAATCDLVISDCGEDALDVLAFSIANRLQARYDSRAELTSAWETLSAHILLQALQTKRTVDDMLDLPDEGAVVQ